MTENTTPERAALLRREAAGIFGRADFDPPGQWPGYFLPNGLAALMAGGFKNDHKAEYLKWQRRINGAIAEGMKAERHEISRTTPASTINTGAQTFFAGGLVPVVATQPGKTTTEIYYRILRKPFAVWLRAIGENPSEYVRAWLGAEFGQQKAESKVERKRAKIQEILGELESLDPDFCRDSMPGRKVDFFTLCKEIARADFAHIREATFSDYLPGLCAFRKGARESDYYRKSLYKLEVK